MSEPIVPALVKVTPEADKPAEKKGLHSVASYVY